MSCSSRVNSKDEEDAFLSLLLSFLNAIQILQQVVITVLVLKSMDPRKECKICGERAKPNKAFYAHYGVICCIGCKAFFRRIHQEKKDVEKLVCKGQHENQCDIRATKRGKCKKCRYISCLNHGLKPEKVLNEEERKIFTFPRRTIVGSPIVQHG